MLHWTLLGSGPGKQGAREGLVTMEDVPSTQGGPRNGQGTRRRRRALHPECREQRGSGLPALACRHLTHPGDRQPSLRTLLSQSPGSWAQLPSAAPRACPWLQTSCGAQPSSWGDALGQAPDIPPVSLNGWSPKIPLPSGDTGLLLSLWSSLWPHCASSTLQLWPRLPCSVLQVRGAITR